MSKKFQIIMNDELCEQVENWAKKYNLSRSYAISRLCQMSLSADTDKQQLVDIINQKFVKVQDNLQYLYDITSEHSSSIRELQEQQNGKKKKH